MHTITHVLGTAAWQINDDGQPWASALTFDDAITLAPDAPLICEHCGRTNEVRPEILSSLTRMLACKSCRKVPTTVNTIETHLGKKAKKVHVVREPSKAQWAMGVINAATKYRNGFGFRSTGSDVLDRKFHLPHARLEQPPMPTKILADEAPTYCQVCDCAITNEFIDGVVAGSGWANMCVECHKEVGTGFGTGRGQKYQKDESGNFILVVENQPSR